MARKLYFDFQDASKTLERLWRTRKHIFPTTLSSHILVKLVEKSKLFHFPLNFLIHVETLRFVNKNSLKSHITSVHEMANLYTCETCGKGKIED